MAEEQLSARLVEIESMLERSRRRFEEGARLVEEAHTLLGELQQALIGSPRTRFPRGQRGSSLATAPVLERRSGGEMPDDACAAAALSVDQVQRLIRIDGHPIGITEMEYRVLELLAFARNNVVTRAMLLKHLYRRADDQPQPKIIDVFISKLRKKLRNAVGRRRVHRDDSAARLDPARHRRDERRLDCSPCDAGARFIGDVLSLAGLARVRMLHLFPCCGARVAIRPSSAEALCRGRVAPRVRSVMRCAWSSRSAADRPRTLPMTRLSPRLGTKPARRRRRWFDRRSARLVGATAAGVEAMLVARQAGCEPHAAASQELVDQIRRELARRRSRRSRLADRPLSGPNRFRCRRVGAPLAPAAIVQAASRRLPSSCAAKIRRLAVTPDPQLATNGCVGSTPASANSRCISSRRFEAARPRGRALEKGRLRAPGM